MYVKQFKGKDGYKVMRWNTKKKIETLKELNKNKDNKNSITEIRIPVEFPPSICSLYHDPVIAQGNGS